MTDGSQPNQDKNTAEDAIKGLFHSTFEEFPGYIQLPNPLMLHHVNAWWVKAVEGVKGLDQRDLKFHQLQWEAARDLLVEFDGWHIENVPIGDAKENRVPAVMVTFVVMMTNSYIGGHLSPKVKVLLRSII